MISRSLEKISEFRRDQKYYNDELKEREEKAESYLKNLPELMSDMFDHLDKLVGD
jgi:hypothetical protein